MTGKVATVTGASRGIGAALVAGYRRKGWAVVTSARTITPSEDRGVLTVTGDPADAEIADRIIGGALRRFGRIDTLVNSAGAFIAPGVSPGITGKILRLDGTPKGQATSRETAG